MPTASVPTAMSGMEASRMPCVAPDSRARKKRCASRSMVISSRGNHTAAPTIMGNTTWLVMNPPSMNATPATTPANRDRGSPSCPRSVRTNR